MYSSLAPEGREREVTEVPLKFLSDLSSRIEQLQRSLRRKQALLGKVSSCS